MFGFFASLLLGRMEVKSKKGHQCSNKFFKKYSFCHFSVLTEKTKIISLKNRKCPENYKPYTLSFNP